MPGIQKVTDPAKRVTDAHFRNTLCKQGIDADYVELIQDYASRRVNGKVVKRRSPYARFYKDRKSNKIVMEVSILPHVKAMGRKIECGWLFAKNKYYSKANLFSAIVDGRQIKVTCLSDQPHEAKKGDQVAWNPQLYLNNIEQTCGKTRLLTADPINAGYFENILEWDYGICKRRIRIIEGRIRERWVFTANPNGEVGIKHNRTGVLKFKSGEYWINDDEELVPASVFDEAEYPFEVMASPETFYPDPHDEVSSVDGRMKHLDLNGLSWVNIIAGAGTGADDDATRLEPVYWRCDGNANTWDNLYRSITVFDTSGLPDTCVVSAAVLSLCGYQKVDPRGDTPAVTIYSADPASNIAIAAGDFDSLGTEALAADIGYANWATDGYNDFTLNDVNSDGFATNADGTYISKTGVSRFGFRETKYDVGPGTPGWVAGSTTYMTCYSADQGNTTSDPKLVITYYVPQTYEESCTDGLKVGDSNIQNLVLNLSITDGLKPGDSPTNIGAFGALSSDGAKFGGSPSSIGAFGHAVTDGAKFGETLLGSLLLNLSLADGAILAEALVWTWDMSLSDGVKLGDAAAPSLVIAISVSDGVKLGEALVCLVNATAGAPRTSFARSVCERVFKDSRTITPVEGG